MINKHLKSIRVKQMVDHDKDYWITESGKIYRFWFSKKNKCTSFKEIKGSTFIGGKESKKEYLRFHIKHTKVYLVHRLVAYYFLTKNLENKVVNHIDNNGLNNSVSNLEVVTQNENNFDYYNRQKDYYKCFYNNSKCNGNIHFVSGIDLDLCKYHIDKQEAQLELLKQPIKLT